MLSLDDEGVKADVWSQAGSLETWSLILSGSWKGEQVGSSRIVESELQGAGSLWLAGMFREPDSGEEWLWSGGAVKGRLSKTLRGEANDHELNSSYLQAIPIFGH